MSIPHSAEVTHWVDQLPTVSAQETKVLSWPRHRFTEGQLSLVPKLAAKRGWKWILFSSERCHFAYVPEEVGSRHLRAWLRSTEAQTQLRAARATLS